VASPKVAKFLVILRLQIFLCRQDKSGSPRFRFNKVQCPTPF